MLVKVGELKEGLLLCQEIISPNNNMILYAGTELNNSLIEKITSWGYNSVEVKEKEKLKEEYAISFDELDQLINLDLKELLKSSEKVSKKEMSEQQKFNSNYDNMLMEVQCLFMHLRIGHKLSIDMVRSMTNNLSKDLFSIPSLFRLLHQDRYVGNYLYSHSIDVALLSAYIGKLVGLSDKEINDLLFTGLVHDIGKTLVRFEYITKNDSLTLEEKKAMSKHVILGYDLLAERMEDEKILKGVLQHHESMDGTGYPMGIMGTNVGTYGKILRIADVYDAIISDRYYRQGKFALDALNIMIYEMRGKFDVDIMAKFSESITTMLLGERVILNDGSKAKIVFFNPFPNLNPIISLDNTGTTVDLIKNPNIKIKSICFEE